MSFSILLILIAITFHCNGKVNITKYLSGLKVEFDFNEHLMNTLLSKTSDYCREDIKNHSIAILSSQSNSKCKLFSEYFVNMKQVKKCNDIGDKEYFNALSKILLAEITKAECDLFSNCTLTNFFRECWMGQLDGLYYVPPIVTDLTPADKGRFESRFLKFSSKSVKNVCCLVKRATKCEQIFTDKNCSFLWKASKPDFLTTFKVFSWKTIGTRQSDPSI